MFSAETPTPAAPPPDQQGLTAYQDTAVVASPATEIPPSGIPFYSGMSAAVTDSPGEALQRSYLVASFPWTTADPINKLLGTVNFPDALFSKSYVADKLRNYRFFRSGVKLSFRLTGNKFMYGCIIASWDPSTSMDSTSSSETNAFTSSGFPHVLLMLNDPTTQEVEIPFIHPQPWIDMASFLSGAIGSVDLTVITPLRFATPMADTTLQVEVYASFIDPQVQVPCRLTSVASPPPIVRTTVDNVYLHSL